MIFVALTAHANTITVNGSCMVGNCSSPDVIEVPPGATFQAPFSFLYMLPNGDQYSFAGVVSVGLAPGQVIHREDVRSLVVTYLGNSDGGVSGNDLLVADFMQRFFVDGRIMPHPEDEMISGRFGTGVGDGSSISGQFTFEGNVFPLLGPFSPPPDEFFGSARALTGGGGDAFENWEIALRFGEGSSVGSSIAVSTAPVPEPSSLVMLAMGGAGMLMGIRRGRTAS
jgi:hypothetical protein